MEYKLVLFADYHQFLVRDLLSQAPGELEFHDGEIARFFSQGDSYLVVFTARNVDVPVVVRFLESESPCQLDEWDHVVDCSIELPTGSFGLESFAGELVLRHALDAGWYRVRLMISGLSTLSDDGLDGEDRYVLEFWPEAESPVVESKLWTEAAD